MEYTIYADGSLFCEEEIDGEWRIDSILSAIRRTGRIYRG